MTRFHRQDIELVDGNLSLYEFLQGFRENVFANTDLDSDFPSMSAGLTSISLFGPPIKLFAVELSCGSSSTNHRKACVSRSNLMAYIP